ILNTNVHVAILTKINVSGFGQVKPVLSQMRAQGICIFHLDKQVSGCRVIFYQRTFQGVIYRSVQVECSSDLSEWITQESIDLRLALVGCFIQNGIQLGRAKSDDRFISIQERRKVIFQVTVGNIRTTRSSNKNK